MIYLKTFEGFLPKFALVTSNARKIREYRELIPNLRVEEGQDLPEVDADDETVAIYKAVDNGPFTISEDTSLEIEGENIGVNLKWFKEKIPTFVGKKAYWKVLLAKNDGEYIKDNFDLDHNDPKYPTVDHKISISYGFNNKIDPNQIGDIKNLCVTKRNLNCLKRNLNEKEFIETLNQSSN